jgi:hypothetical protein
MTSSRSPVADADSTVTAVSETLDAWRQRGADRLDPVRFRFIEAMALRAAAHAGEARRILDERLAQLLAAYGGLVDQAERKKKAVVPPPEPGGLTELLAHIAQQTAPAIDTATASGGAPQGVAGLKSLRYFRSTWSRLSADRRLNQSQAKVPENAGPLNSQHLVHRAITLMRDASPDYLNRLMAYVDTLSWIEQANASAPPSAATRPEGRKAARSKNA